MTLWSGGRGDGTSILNLADRYLGQFPFINFVKTLSSLSGPTNYPSILDVNGYPTSAPSGSNISGTIRLPSTASYSGNYVIDWEGQIATAGNAGLQIAGAGTTVVSGGAFVVGVTTFNLSLTGTNGRVVFNWTSTPSPVTFNILTSGTFSGFTNLRIYRADQESLLTAGEIFNPDFLTQLGELNPRVLRFLDWSAANGGIIPRYKYLPPSAALSWSTTYWYPNAWAGDTSGTDTYTVGNSPDSNSGAYVDGEVIQARVTNANTVTTPTLNRNSLGAKTIINSSGGALGAGDISTNQVATFVYNSLLGKFVYTSEGFVSQTPLDIQLALCNKLSKDCWIPLPVLFDDASAASVVSRAASVLNTGLALYLEFCNEVWNFAFPQTQISDVLGGALGFAVANNERHYSYYALRTRQIGAAAATAWSPRPASQLKRVSAFQAFGTASITDSFRLKGQNLFSVRSGLTATITIASPGVLTLTGQSQQNGNSVVLSTTGALPTGLSPATTYYVVSANTVTGTGSLATTPGGAAINTSGSQSGTHTAVYTNLPYQANVGVDYNVAPNRPIDYVETLSYATYYQGANAKALDSQYTGALTALLTAADDYDSGTPSRMTSALNWLDADIRGAGSETLTDLLSNIYPGWETIRASYTSKGMAGYEGGLQINAPSTSRLTALGIDTAYSAKIAALYSGYKQNDRFRQLVNDQFRQQQSITSVVMPAWYYFCIGTASQWSTHVTDLYGVKFQSYNAMQNFNSSP